MTYGGYAAPSGVVPPAAAPVIPAPAVPAEKKTSNGAQLRLSLPPGATLYVDGQLIPGDGTDRLFSTPDLQPGRTFYYDMKAVVEIDGKAVAEEKRVVVRAGDNLRESFPTLLAAAAAKPAEVAVK